MALDKDTLEAKVDALVKPNGRGSITAKIENEILRDIIEACFNTTSANISNSNLEFDGDHTINMHSYTSRWDHVKQLKLTTDLVTPPSGEATLHVVGSGSSGSNKLAMFESGGGLVMDILSNKSVRIFDKLLIDRIEAPWWGADASVVLTSGIIYTSRGEIGSPYTSHRFTTASSLSSSGSIIASFENNNVPQFIIKANGVINTPYMPTSSTGLSAGDWWCDTSASNAIKMV